MITRIAELFAYTVCFPFKKIRSCFSSRRIAPAPKAPAPPIETRAEDEALVAIRTSIEQTLARLAFPPYEERRFLNGNFEKGHFDSQGVLERGTRFWNGQYEFLLPRPWSNSVGIPKNGKIVLFSLVEIAGEKRIALLESTGTSYRLSKEEPLAILFHPMISCIPSPLIKEMMESSIAPISPQEIVAYALGKGRGGEPPIFSLRNDEDVLAILERAKTLGIPFDLHAPLPNTDETLFSKWVLNGNLKLIRWMLEMDPTCIDQTKNREESFLRSLLKSGREKEKVELIREAMSARGIPISCEEGWLYRIYQGDTSFADGSFTALAPEFQKELYLTAHAWDHEELVERMNRLGMKPVSSSA